MGKGKKKSFTGWTGKGWECYFYYPEWDINNLSLPFIIKKAISKDNIKVRITIEELPQKGGRK